MGVLVETMSLSVGLRTQDYSALIIGFTKRRRQCPGCKEESNVIVLLVMLTTGSVCIRCLKYSYCK